MSDAPGRIHLLGDHRPPAPTKAEKAREDTIKLVEHYMVQIPPMMGEAIAGALVAYDAGRREEFAAFVDTIDGVTAETMAVLTALKQVFGPRPPMPAQPEQES